jgi:hypothetical protein
MHSASKSMQLEVIPEKSPVFKDGFHWLSKHGRIRRDAKQFLSVCAFIKVA